MQPGSGTSWSCSAARAATELAERLRHAVQKGDLSENADYIVAKEEQAFLEGRILELETILREAVIVEGAAADVAAVGSDGGRLRRRAALRRPSTLVGMKEADPRQGRISHESPIGLALMGHTRR